MSDALAPSSRLASQLRTLATAAVVGSALLFAGDASAGEERSELEADQGSHAAPASPFLLMPRSGPRYGMRVLQDPTQPAPPPMEGSAAPAPAAEAAPAAPAPQPIPARRIVTPPRGIGLIVGGSLVAGLVGFPLTVVGALGIAASNRLDEGTDGTVGEGAGDVGGSIGRGLSLVALIPGVLALGGGGAMIAFGAINNKKYQDWKRANGYVLAPSFGATARRTPTYGLRMHF